MASWSDLFERFLDTTLGSPPDAPAIRARFAWVDALHARAQILLDPDALAAMPAHEVYARLKQLTVPQCPIRLTNLGRVNDAERVREAVLKLMTVPGNLEEKYKAAKIPQTGIVTISELLCVAKPMRFMLRNTAFTRAMAKVVPLYTKKALDELPYPEFLDTCRELARIQEDWLAVAGEREWAAKHRYLLLYATLTS